MKLRLLLLLFFAFGGIVFVLYQLYHYPSPESVKPKIQLYLDQQYDHEFTIQHIELHYSQDLFHQPDCYNISVIDSKGETIKDVRIEFNEVQQQWILCYGSQLNKMTDTLH